VRCALASGGTRRRSPAALRTVDGQFSDAYLGRWPVRRGYTYVVWKGRHVAEPLALLRDEASGFWREVTVVASAVTSRSR
jgi:diadenosine tetraphosphate (Ap4A) HIT family hydrolase